MSQPTRRVHLPPAQLAAAAAGLVPLTAAQQRYLGSVLRLRPGDSVEAFDGTGATFRSLLEAGEGGALALHLGPRAEAPAGALDVWLAQALVKADKFELVLQKATELGASRVLPFAASRSVVKLDDQRGSAKVERWRKIAQEAARQCGRADVPAVDRPLRLGELLEIAGRVPGRRGLVLDPGERSLRLSAAARGAVELLLVVGPEGGLSAEELAACESGGLLGVTLGPLVLRTETAGLAALSVLQHLAGALG